MRQPNFYASGRWLKVKKQGRDFFESSQVAVASVLTPFAEMSCD